MAEEQKKTDAQEVEKINGLKVWRTENSVFVSPTMSRAPMNQWMKWEKDCKENYGDSRWTKAWSDHVKAKEDAKFHMIMEKIDALEGEIEFMKTQQNTEEKESDDVKTLGSEE